MNNLTFDKLFDLLEENQFENETDKKIAQKIIEAERDWKTSVNDLNEFINVLEKEVEGTVTNVSLNKLLKKHNRNLSKNAWESESICSLLEIFEFTQEHDLRKIFKEILEKVKIE